MRRLAPIVVLVAAAAAATGGCGDGGPPTATIAGKIVYRGGPVSPLSQPHGGSSHPGQPGRVVVRDAKGQAVASEQVERGHGFEFNVASGRYKLVISNIEGCGRSVEAPAGQTVSANVVCEIP
jgi:hypothetical protein